MKPEEKGIENKPSVGQPRDDFSDLVGTWTPYPAFDEVLAAQRQIDSDEWK
jgi:hypothetical protein